MTNMMNMKISRSTGIFIEDFSVLNLVTGFQCSYSEVSVATAVLTSEFLIFEIELVPFGAHEAK